MCFEINKFCVIMPKIALFYARALITNQVYGTVGWGRGRHAGPPPMPGRAPVPNPAASGTCPDWPAWVRNRRHVVGASRQTRLGQPAAKRHGTASAGLMREHGTHLKKTRKSLSAVARLRAGRSPRASLRADSQTPGSPPPRRRLRGVALTPPSGGSVWRCDDT